MVHVPVQSGHKKVIILDDREVKNAVVDIKIAARLYVPAFTTRGGCTSRAFWTRSHTVTCIGN
jgi:hypothetical protein